jgi:hypothetical protein
MPTDAFGAETDRINDIQHFLLDVEPLEIARYGILLATAQTTWGRGTDRQAALERIWALRDVIPGDALTSVLSMMAHVDEYMDPDLSQRSGREDLWAAGRDAAVALCVRDLIPSGQVTQADYDTLTAAWRVIVSDEFGPLHDLDPEASLDDAAYDRWCRIATDRHDASDVSLTELAVAARDMSDVTVASIGRTGGDSGRGR